jgi:hypothetical protein
VKRDTVFKLIDRKGLPAHRACMPAAIRLSADQLFPAPRHRPATISKRAYNATPPARANRN